MEKIDAGYLYELGPTIRALNNVGRADEHPWSLYSKCKAARDSIESFIHFSIYSPALRTSRVHGDRLVDAIDQMLDILSKSDFAEDCMPEAKAQFMNVYRALGVFEPVMVAELQSMPIFFVPPRGAFDNAYLIERGDAMFPPSLLEKAPETELDVQQAGRCIAFNLPTAAGFHMHRANEAVLRRYYDGIMGAGQRPRVESMGTLLAAMKKAGAGDKNIIAALDALKEFHRNPLMHPEHTLADLDEAMNLYCAIRASIGYMLDEIP